MDISVRKVQQIRDQLRQAQYLSDIISEDASHPVFDVKSSHHQQASKAFQLLQDNIQELSVQLDQAYRKSGKKY
jgi:hypothetical protein